MCGETLCKIKPRRAFQIRPDSGSGHFDAGILRQIRSKMVDIFIVQRRIWDEHSASLNTESPGYPKLALSTQSERVPRLSVSNDRLSIENRWSVLMAQHLT